jgi:hypothetical protein
MSVVREFPPLHDDLFGLFRYHLYPCLYIHQKVKGKNETKDKILLNNVWGEALPNETTALMGPR